MADYVEALGRFRPHTVNTGAGSGSEVERKVTIKTNLAGEGVKFTLNEDLGSIISTGSLTLINADISELGETQSGVVGPNITPSEEDEARWGTFYTQAQVEPNQRVWVVELWGDFETNTDEDGNETYTSLGNGEQCTTYWRVVSFVAYVNEDNIPYCDIQLKSLSEIATEVKIDATNFKGGTAEYLLFMDTLYRDSLIANIEEVSGEDKYTVPNGLSDLVNDPNIIAVSNATDWITPLLEEIGNYYEFSGTVPAIERIPCFKNYTTGENCWQAVDDILSLNGLSARFRRDNSLKVWNVDQDGFGEDAVDIDEYGVGLKVSYTKEGVYNQADVDAVLGVYNEDGNWIPWDKQPVTVRVESAYANNILNGENVLNKLEIHPDMLLKDETEVALWGLKEIYKACMSARGVSYTSNSLALSTEVGMKITGSSAIAGTVTTTVVTLNRTTDAKENTVTTSITGHPEIITGVGDSWLPATYQEISGTVVGSPEATFFDPAAPIPVVFTSGTNTGVDASSTENAV